MMGQFPFQSQKEETPTEALSQNRVSVLLTLNLRAHRVWRIGKGLI